MQVPDSRSAADNGRVGGKTAAVAGKAGDAKPWALPKKPRVVGEKAGGKSISSPAWK